MPWRWRRRRALGHHALVVCDVVIQAQPGADGDRRGELRMFALEQLGFAGRRGPRAPVPAGEGPAGLAAAEGLIWVANYGGTLSRINARTGRLVGPRITTGRGANGVVVHQALIWVPNFHDGTLSRIERSP